MRVAAQRARWSITRRALPTLRSMPPSPFKSISTLLPTYTLISCCSCRAAAKLLQHEIKIYVGSSVEVELKGEGGIERSVGKAKRVVDLRPK